MVVLLQQVQQQPVARTQAVSQSWRRRDQVAVVETLHKVEGLQPPIRSGRALAAESPRNRRRLLEALVAAHLGPLHHQRRLRPPQKEVPAVPGAEVIWVVATEEQTAT